MITKKFKEEYAKLNSRQKEAVDTIDGPVMVVAGPGTGKTTILTLRIANILRLTDTPASSILALTFTENGAKNMRAKLREIIGDLAFQVPIHTFHGFATSVIAEFRDHFPQLARSRQITDIETEVLLREILNQKKFKKLRPLGDPDFYISKIIATISDAKQEAWTPAMLKSFAEEEIERIKQDPTSLSSQGKSRGNLKAEALRRIEKSERTIIFTDVYEAFENKKRMEHKMDFDDLIFELLKTLREDKLLLQSLQEKFLYILLDEHQDTNDAQNLIVRHMADFFDNPNLFVVGDEKQAIYRFQGASVENFLSFQKIWGGMKIISLQDNYRSHQHILDATFKMIENNYGEAEYQNLRIRLKSGLKTKTKPLDLIIAPDAETEEKYLVDSLQNIIKSDKKATVAIMVRRNSEVAKMSALLNEFAIPAVTEQSTNIFTHPAGNLFFSLLEFLFDPANTAALAETLAFGLWRLDFTQKTALIKSVRSGNLAELEKVIPSLAKLQSVIGQSSALEFLHLAADWSGFIEIVSKNPLAAEVWRAILALAENLIRTQEIEASSVLIKELLAYKKSSEKRIIKIKIGRVESRINIMTVHGGKGLEFDYVFMPYAMDKHWIKKNQGSFFVLPKEKVSGDEIRDERRLFYVGLTRARKHIVISFHKTDVFGEEETALRFIDELDQDLISRIELARATKPHQPKNSDSVLDKRKEEMLTYAKNILLTNGLSVTALNHFLECPSKFFYKSILKLPEAPSPSSEKGIAMHEALSKVWQERNKNREKPKILSVKSIEKILIDSVKKYFEHALISKTLKEEILEELIANMPKVALALVSHFANPGIVKTESWAETDFHQKKMKIRLHGKFDVLIEPDFAAGKPENRLLVFDYKTREALSLNAIKGQTRNQQSGDYFRQLVFYKILLSENPAFKSQIISPALVFVKPDKEGRCPIIFVPVENSDVEKVKTEIANLLDSVWSGKFLTETCDNKDCEYCKLRNLALDS